MEHQLIIVIDQPPLQRSPWIRDVFAQADLFEADPREVGKLVKANSEGARALRETYLQTDAQEKVAQWYWAAFQSLYGERPRVGIYGGGWLNLLAPHVDACIVDWSGMAMVTSDMAKKLTIEEINETRQAGVAFGKDYVREREALMPQTQFLALDDGIDDAQRIAQAVAFVRAQFG